MSEKLVVFTGFTGAGKSFLSKYTSRIISNDGKRVALVDASINRGLYYSMCVGEDDMKTRSLQSIEEGKNKAVPFGNIDIFTNKPAAINFQRVFENLRKLEEEYDVVIVDANYEAALMIAQEARLFIVQDFRRESAVRNQQNFLLPLVQVTGEGKLPESTIIYNKAVKCKMRKEEVEQYLMMVKHEDRHYKLLTEAEEAEVPFYMENYITDLNNMTEGLLDTGRFTPDVRKALWEISNMIIPINKNYKAIA